jgi:hypothetical protein
MTAREATSGVDAPARRVGPFRILFVSRLGQAAEIAALVAGTCFALLYWARLPYRLPSPEDYQGAQHELLATSHPGDALAVLPYWADRAKLYANGLPVVALPHLGDEDVGRYVRLFVLAQPDLPRSSAESELAALGRKLARVSGPKRFGPLSLSLYQPQPGNEASLDFTAQIERAQVSVGAESCGPVAGGFQCPRGAWDHVRPEWHEFDFLPRRCLWAQPAGAEPLVITFDQVPLRSEIHGAMGQIGAGHGGGSGAVELAIDIDEVPRVSLLLDSDDPGYHRFAGRFPGLGPGGHRVTFRISSPSPVRHPFCFDAVAY